MSNRIALEISNDDDVRSIEVVFRGVPDDEIADACRLITQLPWWMQQVEDGNLNIGEVEP